MKITTIRFRRLRSHAIGYGHDAIEAEATVDAGEEPSAVLAELKTWVIDELNAETRMRHVERDHDRLSDEVERLTNERDQLRTMVETGRQIIRDHGKISELARANGFEKEAEQLDDGIPF